ncbi:MAG TPA: hypothetical protein VIV40_22455 [Kofleriaceae bacterium]
MRSIARIAAVAIIGACASGTSYVRDPEGRPLPTSAILDADMEPASLWCGNRQYRIVEPPPPYLMGNHMATAEVHVRNAPVLCAKIHAAD